MRSILPPPLTAASAALAACVPAPQEAQVRSDPVAGTVQAAATSAAQAPMPDPVSAAANPYPGPMYAPAVTNTGTDPGTDSAALGRRTLSTAFVRLGPDGYLLVTLRRGTVLRLRDVTMGKTDFCGVAVTGDARRGKRYCHDYGQVADARAVDAAPGMDAISAGPGVVARERIPDRVPDRPR